MTVALRKIETSDRNKPALREDQWRVLCLFLLMTVEVAVAEDDEVPFARLEVAIVEDMLEHWKGPLTEVQQHMLLRMKERVFDMIDDPHNPEDRDAMTLRRYLGELH